MEAYKWEYYDTAAESMVTVKNGKWVSVGGHPLDVRGDFVSVFGKIVLVKKGL